MNKKIKVNRQQQANLTEGDIASTLKRMTIPMIMGMIMMMSFGLVDTFFVSLLGTEQLAAISFTFPVTFTVISLNIGLGIGTSAIVARLRGQQKFDEARSMATGALMLSAILVGLLAALGYLFIAPVFSVMGANDALLVPITDYMQVWYFSAVFLSVPMVGNSVLRACGDTKTPSIIMATGGGINALLDPLLIFGWGPVPALGIQGAALATLIAWFICVIWILRLLTGTRDLMLPRLLSGAELAQRSRQILQIGLPAAGANMLTPIAGGVMTAVVATYGAEAVAAWGVGTRLESIACIVILAMSMTLPPFISQNSGAGLIDRVKQSYLLSIRFIILWQAVIFFVLWLLAGVIADTFAKEPEVAKLLTLFLTIVPLGYGLQGIVILTNSSLNALHLPMAALILSVLRLFVFFVPFAVAGSVWFGLHGVYWGCVVANFAMASLSFIWFKRAVARIDNEQVEKTND